MGQVDVAGTLNQVEDTHLRPVENQGPYSARVMSLRLPIATFARLPAAGEPSWLGTLPLRDGPVSRR